jgi:hypothetical protein
MQKTLKNNQQVPWTTKQNVHDWMIDRARNPRPIPDQKQLRRELGHDLIDMQRELKARQ